MTLHQVDFEETGRFSSIFLDYINNKDSLRPFYAHPPRIDSFKDVIDSRNYDDGQRADLVKALEDQYAGIEAPKTVVENILSLGKKNTFTVTTGHQLNIMTGPLFFIYKIVAVINLAAQLKKKYPDQHFVPVYWMASEDHDFEEISHFRLFGKKYVWEQEGEGPVGRLSTKSMKSLLDEIPELPSFISTAYANSKNLSEATIRIVNQLFGQYGLVILDADQQVLKRQFSKYIEDDILNNHANALVEKTTDKLDEVGYKGQIYPREINFFYMENGFRERLLKEGDRFKINNSATTFTEDEMKDLIKKSPEKFSPNVVMRPLYQEVILPNLAYIGGPAEMAYWLQLQEVFSHYQVAFPVLVPRLFSMIIPKPVLKKMSKNELEITDIFRDFDELKENIISSGDEANYNLDDEIEGLKKIYLSIRDKAGAIDKSLEGFVMSEETKAEKSIENIQKRIKKAEEQRHEISINQVKSILEKLFPNDNLQEREDNFLNFYINEPRFIDELVEELNPLTFRFNVLVADA